MLVPGDLVGVRGTSIAGPVVVTCCRFLVVLLVRRDIAKLVFVCEVDDRGWSMPIRLSSFSWVALH